MVKLEIKVQWHRNHIPEVSNVYGPHKAHKAPEKNYDVIVIGGGHAGSEASAAASRMGAQTLLVTHKKRNREMSCNPSFGGIGKGHLIREIDALDGVCGRICDLSGIQYKRTFENTDNLDVLEAPVEDLNIEIPTSAHNQSRLDCKGIVLRDGTKINSKCVVITTGTFLKGQINIGLDIYPAGRIGDEPSIGLANTLESLHLKMGRLKTGTPPRLKADTINYDVCAVQNGDMPPLPFSFMNDKVWIN
ncbi:hypothetical protein NQ317_016656, partial [Molorchus minor]